MCRFWAEWSCVSPSRRGLQIDSRAALARPVPPHALPRAPWRYCPHDVCNQPPLSRMQPRLPPRRRSTSATSASAPWKSPTTTTPSRKTVTRQRIEAGPASLWRYQDFLPVDAENAIDIGAGYTPLIHARNLGKLLGLPNLYIKNDTDEPDVVLQGPRRRRGQQPRPRAGLRQARLRQHRQPRQQRLRPRGGGRHGGRRLHSRTTSRRARSSARASTTQRWSRSTATTTT